MCHSLRVILRSRAAKLSVLWLLFTIPTGLLAQSDPHHAIDELPGQAGVVARDRHPAVQLSDRSFPTFRNLPRDILNDQKFFWTRPFHPKRKDVLWEAGISGTAAGLLLVDRHVAQNLADSPPGAGYAFSRHVGQVSGILPQLGLCSTFYLVGRWRGNEKSRSTGLLGMRAVLDSAIVVEVLKTASQRPRPTKADGITLNHNADGEFFAGGRAFPSGHAAETWALATVISRKYRKTPWVSPTAYSLAGLVSVSRVTRRKHFPSDVFVGAALGYLIGRQISRETSTEDTEKAEGARLLPELTSHDGTSLEVVWRF